MAGTIVKVWFERESEDGHARAPRFQIIETEMPDFATFCELVEADRFIGGAILFTSRQGDTQVIMGRRPCGFRGSAVLRCELPGNWRYVDAVSP
ncbi:MAG: hypothetical protein LCH92_08195 [Proteobacteria bacterium]|nr:hypothetical protein [Pseudomonadota bacterium]